MASTEDDEGLWLFGYGSLIWKPPPHYDQRVPGYIKGYVRRFWQASEDHRGTPEAPGRVVTLIDKAHWATLNDHHSNDNNDTTSQRVWGTAYHIPPAKVDQVRAYLDIREINGYSIQYTPIYPASGATTTTTTATTTNNDNASSSPSPSTTTATPTIINCLVYIGLPENPQFLGPQDPQALAEHILCSKGPSGENREYLYMLEQALGELGPESGDEHISDLVRRCKKIEEKEKEQKQEQKQQQKQEQEQEQDDESQVKVKGKKEKVQVKGSLADHNHDHNQATPYPQHLTRVISSTEEQEEVEKVI